MSQRSNTTSLTRTVPWRWVGFFFTIAGVWILLISMQDYKDLPEGWQAFGPDYLASLCGISAGSAPALHVLTMWILMSIGMMAPTFVTTLKTYDDLTYTEAASGNLFAVLVLGYLVIWLGFAGVATGIQISLSKIGAIDPNGRSIFYGLNAILLLLAGAYQFSQYKDACLLKCRTPMLFFVGNWKPGTLGALNMGLKLGIVCLGCCWALMLLAFVGGTMSLAWMGLATLVMVFEKLPEFGQYMTRPLGVVMLLGSLVSMFHSLNMFG